MKAVVVRDFGVIVGAYWTPDITLDASNGAEWFLSVNGRALGIEYRSEERYCTYLRKMIPGAPVRSGTDADELARGANMPAEIRQALESAIRDAMAADAAEANAPFLDENPEDDADNCVTPEMRAAWDLADAIISGTAPADIMDRAIKCSAEVARLTRRPFYDCLEEAANSVAVSAISERGAE